MCHSEESSIRDRGNLVQAVQIVQQWKEEELKNEQIEAEFKNNCWIARIFFTIKIRKNRYGRGTLC